MNNLEKATLIGLIATMLPDKPASTHEFGDYYKQLQEEKKRRAALKRERRAAKKGKMS